MFYIHQHTCISPQHTFQDIDLDNLNEVREGKMNVVEPRYESIAPGMLRRMSKAVRMGIGAGMPLTAHHADGIVIGTANGGMEDCIKFLDQIVEYDEGLLTPLSFVQSTSNAVAGQLGMMSRNKSYNITHVHRALAFENAVLDAEMLLKEDAAKSYLLGAVDEISSANYNIEVLDGSYKQEPVSCSTLYDSGTAGSIAGEGAAMFIVNAEPDQASASFHAVHTFQTKDEQAIAEQMRFFLEKHLPPEEQIDLLLSGENGDIRLQKYYELAERQLPVPVAVARFKHMCGEYPTASAFAFWFAVHLLQHQAIPAHALKGNTRPTTIRKVLIYNNYKGLQHSFMLLGV